MTVPNRLIGGRYKVGRKIAEGGMGEVFEAEHNLSKKKVALKVLFPHIGKDEAARQRFLREVSAPAQIDHEGIVEVYDAGFDTEDGSLFVAMEMLKGEPLRDRLARGGVPMNQLLDWFEQCLEPLAMAHEKGIVHRDLKPENIMFTSRRDGSEILKILDFGIARDLDSSESNVTHTGIAMGTPHYMAPEQAMSAKGVSPAADVWALGVMLYEALIGRPPFDGETASAIVVFACTKPHSSLTAVAPHVPTPLARFVDRCLAKEPQGRPQDARAMLAELRQVRQSIGGGASAPIAAHPQATGPMAGAPHNGLMAGQPTPSPAPGFPGTAVLPQATPPPGAFANTATPNPGFQTGPPAPGFNPHTPAPQTYGTPAPQMATPQPGPGYGTAQGPGFGTPPPQSYGTGSAPGFAPMAAPQQKKSSALPVIIGVLAMALVVVGGGITFAAIALSGDDTDEEEATPAGTIGTLRITSNVQAGELFVDGSSRGPFVAGQTFRLAQGSHTVELRENGATVASSQVSITPNQESAVTLNRTGPPPTPNVGTTTPAVTGPTQTFTGQLRPGDNTLNSGEFADSYEFNWTAGGRVQVNVDSSDFDTYVILRYPSGHQEDNDDRPGGGLNAGLITTLSETGTYTVLCTSFASGMTGDYTLTVTGP